MASLTVADIASICAAGFEGDGTRVITGANALEDAAAHEVSFVASDRAIAVSQASGAGCLLVKHDFSAGGDWALVRVQQPRASFAQVLAVLYPSPKPEAFCHPTAIVDPAAIIGADVSIGPLAVISANASVGAGCTIGSGCFIGEGVSIGEQTFLHPKVTIYHRVEIGARVILHSGCVLGADGFGFALVADRYQKFPQVGTVVIEDDVEIGANTCIDRAALGQTVIGAGSKLDNLIHVAHNVKIGRDVVIAAQTGFSGGVKVGDGAIIGGQVGVGDKVTIDSRAVVGSGSGILTCAHVPAGEPYWGTPARPLRKYLKGLAHVNKLGELRRELRDLRQELNAWRGKLDGKGSAQAEKFSSSAQAAEKKTWPV